MGLYTCLVGHVETEAFFNLFLPLRPQRQSLSVFDLFISKFNRIP